MQTFGIYSFPRSGSNWVRNVLYALLARPYVHSYVEDLNIQKAIEAAIPGHPDFDPESGRVFGTTQGEFKFFKSHSPFVVESYKGRPLDTRFYCYIMRHPLDVFLSYLNFLHHYRSSLQWAYSIPLLSVDEHIRSGSMDYFFGMFLAVGNISPGIDSAGSWWTSAENWQLLKKKYEDFIFILKYEDCVSNPERGFAPLANFVGNDCSLPKALEWNRVMFPQDGGFFWKMESGYYTEVLPRSLIESFNAVHGEKLRELGYNA
ncbi:sulfotransferase domain-containing protein [Rhizobium rhizogenes]|uniref:sulfotransferase domain-containing protein n=1 Tax=Rhizobium rhizogenes TaxID=359 RepID=UPI002270DE13|nr:sulfotransferase domain-containing protein [Rhizobium rhizogenes]